MQNRSLERGQVVELIPGEEAVKERIKRQGQNPKGRTLGQSPCLFMDALEVNK